MKRRVVLFGSGDFGLPSWQRLIDHDAIDIVGVVTQPARLAGRQNLLSPTPVNRWATAHHLPVLTPVSLRNNEQVAKQLKVLSADTFIVADYGLIIPPTVLALPPGRCLNIHASLLPAYRGASPIAQSILHGDTQTGVSFMLMDAGLDTGPILTQFPWPLGSQETQPTLRLALANLASDQITTVLRQWWTGQLQPRPQPVTAASLAPKITVADGRADWGSAINLERKCRALTPWPNLWTTWGDQRIKILSATAIPGQATVPPGSIVEHDQGWKISCRDGWLVPNEVQFSGRRPQPAIQIPGSYPGFLGSQFSR